MSSHLEGNSSVRYSDAFRDQIKFKSDRIVNYFLLVFFLAGLGLATFYDTWDVAICVGALSLFAYYLTKLILVNSNAYQYVLGVVLAIYMAQYIFQMHGMFEMHFIAFVGSAILVTYQNWKLQIPLALFVLGHHALFGYLQFVRGEEIYFTQLDYMDLQTFLIHSILATSIFFICGLWAHHFKMYSERHIEQTFELGRCQEENLQRATQLALSEDLKYTNARLSEAQKIAGLGSWNWDLKTGHVQRSEEFYNIFGRTAEEMTATPQGYLACIAADDRERVDAIVKRAVATGEAFTYEARISLPDGSLKDIHAQGKTVLDAVGAAETVYGTVQDITSRKQFEEALIKSNAELRKSNHELDKFVYSVSHDLRAPLLSMKGIADITLMETEEELTRLHMGMINGSIERLDRFIADMLSYSRNARTELTPVAIDLEQMVECVKSDLQHMVSEHSRVSIETDIRQCSAFHSDEGRLRTILNNLVSNAIRYSDPERTDSRVYISILADRQSAAISVRDNGIGICADSQSRVFDMFYRVSEKSSGSGLGLYIVKEVVKKLDGSISLISHPGEGTNFSMEFPNLVDQKN